jgi:DNA-directed RNA polymerase I subunit RPA2
MFLLLRKLYSFAANECSTDNADSLQNQEILLPGHLITSFVKEKFEEMLIAIRLGFLKEMQGDYGKLIAKLHDSVFWNKAIDRFGNLGSGGIGRKVQVFLSTGNIVSSTGLDLMQVSGYTIVAERLNFLRYCAHFRSVHRGQFFMEMKTTSVRKLLPDQWGFLCPVHTPDGGPCGLLSHLALKCKVLADAAVSGSKDSTLDDVLISLGVSPVCTHSESGVGGSSSVHLHLPVCVDGRVAGRLPARQMKTLAARLRRMKIEGDGSVPATLEIVCIPSGEFDVLRLCFPFVDYCQFTLTTVFPLPTS